MGRKIVVDEDDLLKFLSPENPAVHYEGYYGYIVQTADIIKFLTGHYVEAKSQPM